MQAAHHIMQCIKHVTPYPNIFKPFKTLYSNPNLAVVFSSHHFVQTQKDYFERVRAYVVQRPRTCTRTDMSVYPHPSFHRLQTPFKRKTFPRAVLSCYTHTHAPKSSYTPPPLHPQLQLPRLVLCRKIVAISSNLLNSEPVLTCSPKERRINILLYTGLFFLNPEIG